MGWGGKRLTDLVNPILTKSRGVKNELSLVALADPAKTDRKLSLANHSQHPYHYL